MKLKSGNSKLFLTRDNVLLYASPYGAVNSKLVKYELDQASGKLKIHVPSGLTINEIFADIRALLQQLYFADVFDTLTFITSTTLIYRLLMLGVPIGDFSSKTIFEATDKLLTAYFEELVTKNPGQNVVGFLDTEFKKHFSSISVVPDDGNTSSVSGIVTRQTTVQKKESFWGMYIGKIIVLVFAVILILYLIWGLFR